MFDNFYNQPSIRHISVSSFNLKVCDNIAQLSGRVLKKISKTKMKA